METRLACEHVRCGGRGGSSAVAERHGYHRGIGFGVAGVDHRSGENSVHSLSGRTRWTGLLGGEG